MQVSKVDAGIEQLEWAIKLFIFEKAYIPAITLAGAADGIFGELGKGYVFHSICNTLSEKTGHEGKEIGQFINKTRNWLKHANRDNDIKIDSSSLKVEAITRIIIAATSLANIFPEYMSLVFIKFMQKIQIENPECLPEDSPCWVELESIFKNIN